MDHRALDRRSVVAALAAAAAGCLGGADDGGDGQGTDGPADEGTNGATDDGTNGTTDGGTDEDVGSDPERNDTETNETGADGKATLDCDRIDAPYGRYDPGESPLVYTVELPDGAAVTVGQADGLWKLLAEWEVEEYGIKFELSQNGPKSELSPRFRGEGESPVVDEIAFGDANVPMMEYETGDRPQFLTGVPIPGDKNVYATIVTEVDVIDARGQIDDTSCNEAVDAMQRRILGSIEPNPDHTLGSGADG